MEQPQNTGPTFECKFVTYVQSQDPDQPDLHVAKVIKEENGVLTPELKLIYDYKRPFWVVKKAFQNYEQHKEWLEIDKLIKFETTQRQLPRNAAKALGMNGYRGDPRAITQHPYLFGSEILSTAVVKKTYMDKYKKQMTAFNVAVCDTETSMLDDVGDIITMSVTYKDRAVVTVTEDYARGTVNFKEKFYKKLDQYLGEHVKARNLKVEFYIEKNSFECIRRCINFAHETKPDFLAFWNVDFDVTKFELSARLHDGNLADVFSDPSIPKQYRTFEYIQGPKKKVTASGLVTPIKPAAQWHTVICPASFYIIDAMCVYRHVRTGKQEEQSYALDFILNRNKLGGKLNFEEANHVKKGKWHQFMQSNYKVEYCVYNIYDCISVELLDEITKDMCLTFPLFSGFSDFRNFKSQPRRAVDKLHYYCLENDRVISVTASKNSKIKGINDNESDEDVEINPDEETLSLSGWIVTLPAHMVMDNGLKCIEEYPDLRTNIRTHFGD